MNLLRAQNLSLWPPSFFIWFHYNRTTCGGRRWFKIISCLTLHLSNGVFWHLYTCFHSQTALRFKNWLIYTPNLEPNLVVGWALVRQEQRELEGEYLASFSVLTINRVCCSPPLMTNDLPTFTLLSPKTWMESWDESAEYRKNGVKYNWSTTTRIGSGFNFIFRLSQPILDFWIDWWLPTFLLDSGILTFEFLTLEFHSVFSNSLFLVDVQMLLSLLTIDDLSW